MGQDLHRQSALHQLLRTKLAPPRLRALYVARPRLLQRLDKGLDHKLTLLSAPAGFGKTTLVSEWLSGRDANRELSPTAWVSLDEGDNDPIRFWRYLISACQVFDAGVGETSLALLHGARRPVFEPILTALINDFARLAADPVGTAPHTFPRQNFPAVAQAAQYILVLEDYHVIQAQQIHETVAFLLDHLPATLHLVLSTRSEPPLPLARLRANNDVVELRAADLRFSPAEMETFLQQNIAAALPPEAITLFEQHTEGWVAGLQLATLALQRRQPQAVDHFLNAFSGSRQHILDYLTAEVLAAQPESIQTFLLQTTFLNRVTASLCDALTGRNDSAAVLDQLERANLFLSSLDEAGESPHSARGNHSPVVALAEHVAPHISRTDAYESPRISRTDAYDKWYRYHPLFAEAMQQVARRHLGEAALRGLYNKASLWYEQSGYLPDAVEIALVARLFLRAAELIEHLTDKQNYRELHTLRRWIEQLPEDLLRNRPGICLTHAIAILFTSDRSAPATAAQVEKPMQMAEQSWLNAENESRLGQLYAFRSLVAFWQGDFSRMFAAARQALDLLAEEDIYWRGISLLNLTLELAFAGRTNTTRQKLLEARTLSEAARNGYAVRAATLMLGQVCIDQGELQQAEQLFRQVLAGAGNDRLDEGHSLIGLALLAYEWNDLEPIDGYIARALEIGRLHTADLGEQHMTEALTVPGSLILAQVEHARGQTTQARQRLQALRAETQVSSLCRREVHTWQARLALADGDMAVVERWHADYAQENEHLFPLHQEREAQLYARILIAKGKIIKALHLLEQWQAHAHTHGRAGGEIKTLILMALAYFARNDSPAAKQALIQALTLARPSGYRRIFLDEGETMAALLQAVYPDVREHPLGVYVRNLLFAFAGEPVETATAAASSVQDPLLVEPLTAQEERVLRLLAAGLSNPEIARELVVSVNTVKTQVQSIYRKLDVHSREKAGDAARQLALI